MRRFNALTTAEEARDQSMPTSWTAYEANPVRFKTAEDCFNFLDIAALELSSNETEAVTFPSSATSATTDIYCNATWDRTLCWPATPANTTIKLPCPPWFDALDKTKFSYRTCGSNGLWTGDPSGKYSKQTNPNGWTNYMDCYPDWIKNDLPAIKIISFAARILETTGLALSLVTLSASIAIFFYFKNIRCDRIRIHRNLFVAITVHVIILLTKNIDQLVALTRNKSADVKSVMTTGALDSSIDSIPVVCQLLICGVEYTKTVVFAWMFIEGLYLHNKLIVSVFSFKPNYTLYYLIGWGLPLFDTATWAAVSAFLAEHKCWFAYSHKRYFWILEAPRISVIIVNMVFLLNILRVVVTKLRESNTAEIEQIRKAAKAALLLLPLLGANHVLAITGPSDYSRESYALWAFISFFLTAFQGFIIALLYCFLNTEVRNAVHQQWQRRRDSRPLPSRRSSTGMTSFSEVRTTSYSPVLPTRNYHCLLPSVTET